MEELSLGLDELVFRVKADEFMCDVLQLLAVAGGCFQVPACEEAEGCCQAGGVAVGKHAV